MAIPFFDKAIRLNDQSKEALLLRGYSNFCLDKHDAAIADLTKVIEIDTANQTAYILLTKIYLDMNLENKACEVIKSAGRNAVEIPDKLFRKSCE